MYSFVFIICIYNELLIVPPYECIIIIFGNKIKLILNSISLEHFALPSHYTLHESLMSTLVKPILHPSLRKGLLQSHGAFGNGKHLYEEWQRGCNTKLVGTLRLRPDSGENKETCFEATGSSMSMQCNYRGKALVIFIFDLSVKLLRLFKPQNSRKTATDHNYI